MMQNVPSQNAIHTTNNKLPLLITGVVILIIFLGSAGISLYLLKGKPTKKLTPKDFLPKRTAVNISDIVLNKDALYFSLPVTSFDGKLAAIDGDTISVVHHYVLPDTLGNVKPDQKAKDVTFRFVILPATRIYRSSIYVPYLLKQNVSNANEPLNANQLKDGFLVAVTADEDLRIASPVPFTAKSVQVTRISNSIRGIIGHRSDNTFTVHSALPPLPGVFPSDISIPDHEYTVHIKEDTEISARVGDTPVLLDPDRLTNGTMVTVYTVEDTAIDTQVTALLILPEGVVPISSPSPNPK